MYAELLLRRIYRAHITEMTGQPLNWLQADKPVSSLQFQPLLPRNLQYLVSSWLGDALSPHVVVWIFRQTLFTMLVGIQSDEGGEHERGYIEVQRNNGYILRCINTALVFWCLCSPINFVFTQTSTRTFWI